MRFIILIISLLSCFPVLADEWNQKKCFVVRCSVNIQLEKYNATLRFNRIVTPGEELASSSEYDEASSIKIYLRYTLLGVQSGSLVIQVRGASASNGEKAVDDPGFKSVLYIEKADDGSFYFVPSATNNRGVLKITRDTEFKAYYNVIAIKSNPYL